MEEQLDPCVRKFFYKHPGSINSYALNTHAEDMINMLGQCDAAIVQNKRLNDLGTIFRNDHPASLTHNTLSFVCLFLKVSLAHVKKILALPQPKLPELLKSMEDCFLSNTEKKPLTNQKNYGTLFDEEIPYKESTLKTAITNLLSCALLSQYNQSVFAEYLPPDESCHCCIML